MLKRFLIVVHRWLGVALCLIFLLWFPSGIGMMYWDFPSVGRADLLEHLPALDPSKIALSPAEAAAGLGESQPYGQVRLNTFDGRPVYRFTAGGGEALVYADSGEEQIEVSKAMVDRIASAWTGRRLSDATVEAIEEPDQWTLQIRLGDLSPLWKYSWATGEQVYVSEATGEVVQYTTTASRLGAYVGAIPHWLYFPPLRRHGAQWSRLVIWASGIGMGSAILGVVIGLWMYSPRKRYRYDGAPTSIPYRGQKRLHTIFGLIFGVATATWAFSGLLSMDPFPTSRTGRPPGRRGGGAAIGQVLRGPAGDLSAFADKHPRQALAQLSNRPVKELELTTFGGVPIYMATLAGGETRIVPVHGDPRAEFTRQEIIDLVAKGTEASGGAEITLLQQYDSYYVDRRRERPLPVILVRLNDDEHTRYYIDPRTARIAGTYSSRNWVSRWLYHGLHSLDFPWLYNHRPLWDIVVITFMVGGTALSVTSLILAWRVLGRKLNRMIVRRDSRDPPASEDLVLEADG